MTTNERDLNATNDEANLIQSTRTTIYLKKPSKPYHVGIHWIAPIEYSQVSTHVPGFQSFSRFLHHFVLAGLATSGIRVATLCLDPSKTTM